MNNERMSLLLKYMDGLTRLQHDGEFLCQREVTECLGWIREEFTKEPKDDITTVEYNAGGKTVAYREVSRND